MGDHIFSDGKGQGVQPLEGSLGSCYRFVQGGKDAVLTRRFGRSGAIIAGTVARGVWWFSRRGWWRPGTADFPHDPFDNCLNLRIVHQSFIPSL
jgi:hypothetical protein